MKYLTICLILSTCLYAVESVKIGVLAKRGAEVTFKKWNDTALYLSQKIPDKKFEIVPIKFDDMHEVVKSEEISFILTNPGMYIDLEYRLGIQRITTLINKHISGITQKEFGGVLISHIDNEDRFNEIESVKDASLAAVNEKSLGGWQMIWREMVENDIDVEDDLKSITFKGTHDKVVYAVLNKEVDLGTVRTDTVERMAMEGKLDITKLHFVAVKSYENFPFIVSTKLYPEWPMAKLKHTPDELSKRVAIALISMSKDDKAAKSASISGWTTPLRYTPVHECFKTLQIPPYYQKIEFIDVIEEYWQWILFYLFLAVNGIAMLLYQIRITRNLKATQQELVQTEKMASLGRLVAGIAHEINTPIGVGVTAASHLYKETEKFNDDYKAENVTQNSFEEFIETSMQSSEMILANLDRAAKMIHNFKQISVDQASDEIREFDLKEYVEGIINSLKPTLKKTSHDISLVCKDVLHIESNPGVFSQIFSNLIMNSVIHAFEGIEHGHIIIELERRGSGLHISYSDDGRGMSKDSLKKIYDPFFTTKRSEGGSGLGTHIIYNLVTQKLHGTISAESDIGQGLKYSIDLKGVKYV